MDKDVRELRRVVMGHSTVQRAANNNHVGNIQARAEDIDDTRMFGSQDFNGRVLKSNLNYSPGKALLKPLPKR